MRGHLALLLALASSSPSLVRANSALNQWLQDLTIPLPANASSELPGGMGMFTMFSGECSDLSLDQVEVLDLSPQDGQNLEFAFNITGLGIHCVVKGFSHGHDANTSGPVAINITLHESSMIAGIEVLPYISEPSGLPLPMGKLNVTSCDADMKVTFMSWEGHGLLIETLESMTDEILQVVGPSFTDPMCEGMTDFFAKNATAILEKYQRKADMMMQPPRPPPSATALVDVVDWGSYPPVGVVQALIEERWPLFAGRALDLMNLAELDSEVATIHGLIVSLLGLDVSGVVDGWSDGMSIVANETSVGMAVSVAGMRVALSFGLHCVDENGEARNQSTFNVTLGLEEIMLVVQAMFDAERMSNLKVDAAVDSPGCAADLVDGSSIPRKAALQVDALAITLAPPLALHAAAELEEDGSQVFNTIVSGLFQKYHMSIGTAINGALAMSRPRMTNAIWKYFDSLPPCPRSAWDAISSLYWATLILALIGIPFSAFVQFMSSKKAPGNADEGVDELETRPLCLQSFVPRSVMVYYLFAVTACMLMFLGADLDVGATVTMVMAADGKEAELGPLFSFSLVSTVEHCWSSGSYLIAILTILASGVWPMVKLALLIVAWTTPPRYLGLMTRGRIVSFLDAWGKYSFLDSWFLVVTLSAFAINWESVANASMKLQTTPQKAFYSFLAATVLSLILGHVASECHQHAVDAKEGRCAQGIGAHGGEQQQSQQQQQRLEKRVALCSLTTSRVQQVGVIACVVVSAVIAAIGIFTPSFSFEASGLLTEFLFGDKIAKSYSLFSVGSATSEGRYGESGLLCLEAIFVTLSIIVPFVLLASLLVVWLVPMRAQSQKHALRACYMLDAWASLDVAVLVMAIAWSEFARLATFLVYAGNFAAPCLVIKDVTKEECLNIALKGHSTLPFVFASGLLLLVVPKLVMHLARQLLDSRFGDCCASKAERASAENKVGDSSKNGAVSDIAAQS